MKQWSLNARSKDQSDDSLSLWKGGRGKLWGLARQIAPPCPLNLAILRQLCDLPVIYRSEVWDER